MVVTMCREFPTDTRVINRQNQVYFAKWHYMKYCTQVIQYSMRRGLRLRADIEEQGAIAQKQVLENVPISPWGSGRLTQQEFETNVQKENGRRPLSKVPDRTRLERGALESLLPPRAAKR
ncbi:unnamed protein product [Symbiodinium natans]|uniref:Uncharacterized protein n=1 Tax=Symbiodinium natans TaxID=878477 RepID=A0A812SYE3_9DINO|nr:unnamed protein product [Symbiodinium natans]